MNTKDRIEIFMQALGVLILAWYTFKTHQMQKSIRKSTEVSEAVLQEMKVAREEAAAPYVVVYFDVSDEADPCPEIYLNIKNEGKTTAKNVRLSFDPQLPTLKYIAKSRNLNDLYLVKEGIPLLPPGYRIRTTFGLFPEFAKNGSIYKVNVSYFDRQNLKCVAEYVLDISPFSDLLYDFPQGLPVLIKEVADTRESINRIGADLSRFTNKLEDGIWINSNSDSLETPLPREQWKATTQSKLMEFKLMWSSLYGVDYGRFNDGTFFSNLKNYYTNVGKRLLILVSLAPNDIPQNLRENLTLLSKELLEVEDPKLVAAEKDLDKYGNRFLEIIEGILEQIRYYPSLSDNHPPTLFHAGHQNPE